MTLTWKDKLKQRLTRQHTEKKASLLFEKYSAAFLASYKNKCTPALAVNDIAHMDTLSDADPLKTLFYYQQGKTDYPLHLRLFQLDKSTPLYTILPILENFNLQVYDETLHSIQLSAKKTIWISDFSVKYAGGHFDLDIAKRLFEDAFTQVATGLAENDGFNKLILGAGLAAREAMVLRAYARYLHQAEFHFSQVYIENALCQHPSIARSLFDLFFTLHNPRQSGAAASASDLEHSIIQALDAVSSLDEERIILRLLDLIKATLRTNYFQTTKNNLPKPYLAFKLNSDAVPDLRLPLPLYEIFVYSPRFEGIHLRGDKIARGGIRWSDRKEDFRTEVLGLMKAQKVKNAVIVPSGAKGGFVLKMLPQPASHESTQAEVIACYTAFISGLLDLTDNIKNKKMIRPKNVVCLDDPDSYLVVAADKGTATFSDIANHIAHDYQFWLGDAFASGGTDGYDHKKIGITARGAWESIKRHFRELNINILQSSISVVGIGDMSGDVFGNGLLYSKRLQLIGAFDHRHIFIDPNPNPAVSFKERARLFKLARSSWEDYNVSLISKGGGVFKRSSKSIALSPEIKKALAISDNSLTPNALICALLKAPVDLLFNGGIGTYVKARTESDADVGDRTNDYCRVNGDELRCKVVGEGGNLGFTQLGRIEFALKGGLINTDFIDNSAGVDCSDHEVNLKILLHHAIQTGKLADSKRNTFLASLTSEVAELVLNDNYLQAWVMSFSAYHAANNLELHRSYLKELTSNGILNRHVEHLPTEKQLIERKAEKKGLTRPELAVLLAYTKIYVKREILNSALPEHVLLRSEAAFAFPQAIRSKFQTDISDHLLHRNIIATELSNRVVNEMGITFIYRMQTETGASIHEIIKAYFVSSHIFDSAAIRQVIESLDFKISAKDQFDMLFNVRNLISLSTRWFLRSSHMKGDLTRLIAHYSKRLMILEKRLPQLMGGKTKDYLTNLVTQFVHAGLPKHSARRIATFRAIYANLNIISVATDHQFDLIKTAEVYFHAGDRVNLLWFRDKILNDTREGHWNVMARLTLRDELDISQRELTIAILKEDKNGMTSKELIDIWVSKNKDALTRWESLLTLLYGCIDVDYTMFFIAIRELLGLIIASHRKATALDELGLN